MWYRQFILFFIILALFKTGIAHDHLDTNKSYENEDTIQVCSNPLESSLGYDCLALSKLSLFKDSNNNINASLLDISYTRDNNTTKLNRTILTSRIMVNCDAYTLSVQIAPYNRWTAWDHIKSDELVYKIIEKICPMSIKSYSPPINP